MRLRVLGLTVKILALRFIVHESVVAPPTPHVPSPSHFCRSSTECKLKNKKEKKKQVAREQG